MRRIFYVIQDYKPTLLPFNWISFTRISFTLETSHFACLAHTFLGTCHIHIIVHNWLIPAIFSSCASLTMGPDIFHTCALLTLRTKTSFGPGNQLFCLLGLTHPRKQLFSTMSPHSPWEPAIFHTEPSLTLGTSYLLYSALNTLGTSYFPYLALTYPGNQLFAILGPQYPGNKLFSILSPHLPRKPAIFCAWSSSEDQTLCFIDCQSLMDVASWINVGSHRTF